MLPFSEEYRVFLAQYCSPYCVETGVGDLRYTKKKEGKGRAEGQRVSQKTDESRAA